MTANPSESTQLTRFQIFPRETIRAAIKISRSFAAQTPNSRDGAYTLQEKCKDLLCRESLRWPLYVQVGSVLWDQLATFVDIAKDLSSPETRLGSFLVPLPDFYDIALVDKEGLYASPVVVELERPLMNVKRSINNDIPDVKVHPEQLFTYFKDLQIAAVFMSELFPDDQARTEAWYQRRTCMLADVPNDLKGIAAIYPENDRTPEVKMTGNMDISSSLTLAQGEEDDPDLISPMSSDSFMSSFSSAESRGTTPAPSEDTATNEEPTDRNGNKASLELTVFVQLQAGDQTIHFPINPTSIDTPEKQILVVTTELWDWLAEKGFAESMDLKDVMEFASKIVGSTKVAASD